MDINVKNICLAASDKERRPILDGVSFTVPSGAFVSLLGPSGAGKSTMLKVLSGISMQDSGTVEFDGQPVDALSADKRNLGFVFQDIRLFPNMTVGQNVAFGLKMRGMDKEMREKRADEILNRVHLGGFAPRRPNSLSGGQAQRVALARALASNPQALLLDEPFSGLDENLRDDMRSLVLGLHRQDGLTTLMVTHDAIEALELSDWIIYLDQGHVLQQGTPEEIFLHPASAEVAACFGDCSVLKGVVRDDAFICADLSIPLAETANAAALETGIHDPLSVQCAAEAPATAVIRFGDVSFDEIAGICLGAIPNRCSVYRGTEILYRMDLAGQTLTVPCTQTRLAGGTWNVYARPKSVFVYLD